MTGATDAEAQLIFYLGGSTGTIQLDNIVMVRTSVYYDPNLDYYPLVNGDFAQGMNPWETAIDSGGAVSGVVENGAAKLTIASQGTNPWSAMFIQNGLNLSNGITYVLGFDARSSTNRKLEVIVENAAYTRFIDRTVDLTNEMTHHEFEFTMPKNDTASLKFLMGLISGTTAVGASHNVFIDNVVLEVKDAPVSRAPRLLADPTASKVGQSVEITFADDAQWRESVTAVKLNDTVLSPDKYVLTAGKLMLTSDNFGIAANYSITIEATGYVRASVKQLMLADDGNLVINGDMSNGLESWTHWAGDGGASTIKVEAGAATIEVTNNGGIHPEWNIPVGWSTQFYQEGIKLQAGKTYELSFKAWSTLDRPITVEYTNTIIPAVSFNITNNAATIYTNRFTVTGNSVLKLNYLLGNVTNGSMTTPTATHTLSIDDVVLKEVKPGSPGEGAISVLGAGSYSRQLPTGAVNVVQSTIHKTDNVTGKMQTNDWWSNLAWDTYSEAQYPHPLAMKNQASGMRIYYPGNRITGDSRCVCGWMNDIHDFTVGHSNAATFPEAKVDSFSDWFVTAQYKTGNNGMNITYGHGSPYVYFTYEGGNPKVSFYTAPIVWSDDKDSSVLGITIAGAHYGLFGPTGSTWSGIGTTTLTNILPEGKAYFSIAALPDNTAATLNKFKQYAYSHVTGTTVDWSYDARKARLTRPLRIRQ